MSRDKKTYIEYETIDSVAVVRLARHEKLNTLSAEFWLEWREAVRKANEDTGIDVIVVVSKSEKVFCAGGDMEECFLPRMNGEIPYDPDDHFLGGLGLPFDVVGVIRESKPIIAAISGVAAGGGITAFLSCDIIVASETARFMFPFVKLGIVPEMCSTHYLAKRVGFARASEILLTGATVDALEALQVGLVNRVVPAEDLFPTALSIAGKIAQNPPSVSVFTKQLLSENCDEQDISKVWQRESDILRQCFSMSSHKEAVTAFIEKRAPDFSKCESPQ